MRALGLSVLALCALFFACPGGKGGGEDAGTDAGEDGGFTPTDPIITVSGTATVYPEAAAWMADAGLSVPSVAGLTLRVEEPLRVALNDPLGVFGTQLLDDGGTFRITNVDTSLVSLGIGAGVRDETDGGRVVRVATAIYDVALAGGEKPKTDLVGAKAFALPSAFHDQLTQAIGASQISTITGGQDTTLVAAGFILGRVLDASGNPVVGAHVSTDPSQYTAQIFYPSADLSTADQTQTHESGLFVFVHNGGQVDQFKISVQGHSEYVARSAGAVAGAGLLLEVTPGSP